MSLAKATKGRLIEARRVLLYGVHGCGKSTWGVQWPNHVLLDTEKSTEDLNVHTRVTIESVDDILTTTKEVATMEQKPCDTFIIDSFDWAVKMFTDQFCQLKNKKTLADFDFGKGKEGIENIVQNYLKSLTKIASRGIDVVLICHARYEKIEPPNAPSYKKYAPKMVDTVSAMTQEWATDVLFIESEFLTKTEDEGFNRERSIVIDSTANRVMHTTDTPSHFAKNRLDLPPKMAFDRNNYSEFRKYLDKARSK